MPIYINGGGGKVRNIPHPVSIIFFDWDESTTLGAITVDGTNIGEIKRQIDKFTANLYPAGYDQSIPVEDRKYDQASPLTNKKGYSFGKWIECDAVDDKGEKVYTIYGEAISLVDSGAKVTIPEPKGVDFANLSKGYLTLKAAFLPNKELVSMNSAPDAYYGISLVGYNRYGSSATYSITVDVARHNGVAPVHRCREIAIIVSAQTTVGTVYSLVSLKNIDEQRVDVPVPAGVTNVTLNVIDIGGTTNWVTASATRSNTYRDIPGTTAGQDGFMFKGNHSYINEQLRVDGTILPTHYSTAGLNVSAGNVFGTDSTNAGVLRTQALANLKKAYNDKNINGTAVGLTWQEMVDAIKLGAVPAPLPNPTTKEEL